jgi:cytochrome c oxidase subunit II
MIAPWLSAVLLQQLQLRPADGTAVARDVDALYFVLAGISLFFTFLIFGLILYFMVKYRRRSPDEIPPPVATSIALEVTWTVIPTVISLGLFLWGAKLYVRNSEPPPGATEVFVVGKQWMWHLQHPEGRKEINELHVPVGVPVKLTLTSQDVIHDFFVPAFRIKRDVLPGRYVTMWFEATTVGTYRYFCSQYCGTAHSAMIGWVYVMSPRDYAAWLSEGAGSDSMAASGAQLFAEYGCAHCHLDPAGRSPQLAGIFGRATTDSDGRAASIDENYVRRAIVNPVASAAASGVAMPSFQGQMNEEQLLQVIAYIKTLPPAEEGRLIR